jgi:tetratricopeptide (TPR) repeat protein
LVTFSTTSTRIQTTQHLTTPTKMILTNCAACAAPLAYDHKKRCSRCKTRYCNEACQREHWERGGHEALCRRIKRGGGAEQYHAERKYNEAVAVAAEACADDTRGQTCYICMQGINPRTGEGLVRGCACGDRDGVDAGTTGVAHVSCLARQAKILVAEGLENSLDNEAMNERWTRWHECSLCKQGYHGVVRCALGWACWKTYVGRPETDNLRGLAMGLLGNGLCAVHNYEDALSVQYAKLFTMRRVGYSESHLLADKTNLSNTYSSMGLYEQALQMEKEIYSGHLEFLGEDREETMRAASNCAITLVNLERFEEARSLLRKTIPVARRVFGESHKHTLTTRSIYAATFYKDTGATIDDLREAVTTFEETEPTARRVFGGAHPVVAQMQRDLRNARAALRARETPPPQA